MPHIVIRSSNRNINRNRKIRLLDVVSFDWAPDYNYLVTYKSGLNYYVKLVDMSAQRTGGSASYWIAPRS